MTFVQKCGGGLTARARSHEVSGRKTARQSTLSIHAGSRLGKTSDIMKPTRPSTDGPSEANRSARTAGVRASFDRDSGSTSEAPASTVPPKRASRASFGGRGSADGARGSRDGDRRRSSFDAGEAALIVHMDDEKAKIAEQNKIARRQSAMQRFSVRHSDSPSRLHAHELSKVVCTREPTPPFLLRHW